MSNNLVTQSDDERVRPPRTREQREAATQKHPAPLIFGASLLVLAIFLGYSMGGGQQRTEDEFMTEVEYYQKQLDVQRAEFNGYRAGVNESRGQ